MTRGGRTALGVISSAAGAAVLVWYLRRVGLDRIETGLAAVGAGLAGILAISLARFALRAAAWTALIAEPVPFGRAIGATIGGDALGNLTPIGLVVSEPAKALYLGGDVATGRGFSALMAENFFYSISIAVYIMLGAAAMLEAFALPHAVRLAGIWSLVAMAAALVAAGWVAWRKPAAASALLSRLPFSRLGAVVDRVREFEVKTYGATGRHGVRLDVVILYETLFHVLSFIEAWYTVWLLTGTSRPLEAFILDGFSRVSNIAFRIIPLRLGVDQAGSGLVAQAIGLDPALGATLSIVRTGRILIWAVVGIGIMARRGWSPVNGKM
jgi:hypothetical protein